MFLLLNLLAQLHVVRGRIAFASLLAPLRNVFGCVQILDLVVQASAVLLLNVFADQRLVSLEFASVDAAPLMLFPVLGE